MLIIPNIINIPFLGDFNAIYVGPKSGDAKEVPLIVWPHGGPHSAFANFFFLEQAVFLALGENWFY